MPSATIASFMCALHVFEYKEEIVKMVPNFPFIQTPEYQLTMSPTLSSALKNQPFNILSTLHCTNYSFFELDPQMLQSKTKKLSEKN